MKKLLILLICLPLFTLAQQTINESITHGGLQRDYIIHIPSSYNVNTPIPLVFCFHGYGSNASTNMSYTNFNYISDTAGFIVVYPQGTLLQGTTHWNVGGWTTASTIDDVGFTASLLDSISNAYTIDDTRVYSTGMSNGGYMSFLLACQLSNRIAAIASVTGSMVHKHTMHAILNILLLFYKSMERVIKLFPMLEIQHGQNLLMMFFNIG